MLNELVISYIVVVICGFCILESYRKISNERKKIYSIRNILVVMASSIIEMKLVLEYYGVYKIMMIFLTIYIMTIIVFKENYKKVFAKVIIVQTIEVIIEVALSGILILIDEDIKSYDEVYMLKNAVSILIALIELLLLNIRRIRVFIKEIVRLMTEERGKVTRVILIIFYIFITYLVFISMIKVRKENYILNGMFLIIVLGALVYGIYNKIIIVKKEEKEKVLLEFMKKYEYLIDKDKENRHEMLNNLIILNSYKDKNSKVFKKEIDKMIETYGENSKKVLSNIGALPSGIKGVLYYKISDIERNKIKLIFSCDKRVEKYLRDTNNLEYTKYCKVLGIIMDNAIEASKRSEEKEIIIDIYMERERLHIYVENSIKGVVEIEKINRKGYSSKGMNRGIGLYIASNIKRKSKNIDYVQRLTSNNHFVTDLSLKVK